ncbi:hypothetical protein [Streptomyces hydrogenans]|uniref:hypothetical protein n=1 Tax=Streptomyces hydrogenans TaxID=1873719 RepID=UPI0036EDFF89
MTQPEPTQPRHTADSITGTALDELYAERDALLAELDGRDEEARERWIQQQLDQTGLKAMDFRNGMSMEIEPARELVAHWVGAARAMLGDAPNYTETPIEMEVKVAESPERFVFVLQRFGKLTPHQARQRAEERAERAEADVEALRGHLRYVLDYKGPGHAHVVSGRWDADGSPCDHCARLAAAREALGTAPTPEEGTS